MPDQSPERKSAWWSLFHTGIRAWAVILTLIGGVIAFLVQSDAAIDAEIRKSRAPFLEKQQELYFDAIALASKFATRGVDEFWREELTEYWKLYWGVLGTVEDTEVESAMVIFARSLNAKILLARCDRAAGPCSNSDLFRVPQEAVEACAGAISSASLYLSHCIYKSLERNWRPNTIAAKVKERFLDTGHRRRNLNCTTEFQTKLVEQCPKEVFEPLSRPPFEFYDRISSKPPSKSAATK